MVFQVAVENPSEIANLTPTNVRKGLSERSDMLKAIFDESGPDFDPSKVKVHAFKDGLAMREFVRNLNTELDEFGKAATALDELDKGKAAAERWSQYGKGYDSDPSRFAPGGKGNGQPIRFKGIGQTFVESELFAGAKGHVKDARVIVDDFDARAFLEQKTAFSTSAGWAPQAIRTGRVVFDEQREIEVTDILPVFPTNQAAIVYMEETTFTNAAAERAEAAAYAEATLALTERSKTVRSVGVSLPVTDEQMDDIEGASAYVDGRLGFMVRQKLDSQIIVGSGTPPALEGTLNVSGISTQALGTDTIIDAFYKARKKVMITGRAIPNVAFAHPNDWEQVQLMKTTDGVYIWGSPSDAGPARIWGLPVIVTTAITEGYGLVGDYARFSGLHVRKGLELQTGYVNDDFLNGKQTVRAGIRVAAVHYRPSAFCQITGI